MGFTWEFDCHMYYRRANAVALGLGSLSYWGRRTDRPHAQEECGVELDDAGWVERSETHHSGRQKGWGALRSPIPRSRRENAAED
jgi:hypothetical protein